MIIGQSQVNSDLNGVYGIFINDYLIYIGSTTRSFKIRLQEHNKSINEGQSYLYLFIRKHNCDKFTMRPLVVADFMRTKRDVGKEELDGIEFGLISCFRPKCNVSGLKTNFIFRH